jgi:hypothetical protein
MMTARLMRLPAGRCEGGLFAARRSPGRGERIQECFVEWLGYRRGSRTLVQEVARESWRLVGGALGWTVLALAPGKTSAWTCHFYPSHPYGTQHPQAMVHVVPCPFAT